MEATDELRELVEADPRATAYCAAFELHNGRIEWLAEHIRRCDFQIDREVAKKLLSLLDGSHPYYSLTIVRRTDLPRAAKNDERERFRHFDMAIEVARLEGFKRGHLLNACEVVGRRYKLSPDYVRKCVSAYRRIAMEAVYEERMRRPYEDDKMDISEV